VKRVVFAGASADGLDRCYLESWIGFERTLRLVLPRIKVAAFIRDRTSEEPSADFSSVAQRLLAELRADRLEMRETIVGLLGSPLDSVTVETNLADLGFDSITLNQFAASLSRHYGVDLTPAVFFVHTTVAQLRSTCLQSTARSSGRSIATPRVTTRKISERLPRCPPNSTRRRVSRQRLAPVAAAECIVTRSPSLA
jgi:aryl carrier-like protein